MKKMNSKEFWEILEQNGHSKEVFVYEGILNIISIHLGEKAKDLHEKNLHIIAEKAEEQKQAIFDILNKKYNYYTN